MELKEYDTWYEVWGYDGSQWEYVTHFATRAAADYFTRTPRMDKYEETQVRKGRGQL